MLFPDEAYPFLNKRVIGPNGGRFVNEPAPPPSRPGPFGKTQLSSPGRGVCTKMAVLQQYLSVSQAKSCQRHILRGRRLRSVPVQ